MPERAIYQKNAKGFLLILLPAALAISALFVAWPFILAITLLVAGGNIWQNYEWSKTIQSIDPSFQQLIVQNRGEITPVDLSIKANIPGKVAMRYLVTKADEFGTGSRQYPDRGRVFYFISASTLGSIFDDSESEDLPAIVSATAPVVSTPLVTQPSAAVEVLQNSTTEVAPIEATANSLPEPDASPAAQPSSADLSNPARLLDGQPISIPTATSEGAAAVADTHSEPPTVGAASPLENRPLVTILQSELAKRLDVHSSTIYKRRSEPNFTDWTRNRDPEGLAWGYLESTKEYYRIDT